MRFLLAQVIVGKLSSKCSWLERKFSDSSAAADSSALPGYLLHRPQVGGFVCLLIWRDGHCRLLLTLLKPELSPWMVWLGWLEHHPITERLWLWFSVRAHVSVAGLAPGLGLCDLHPVGVHVGGNQNASLSHGWFSVSLPLSLKAMKKCPQVRI